MHLDKKIDNDKRRIQYCSCHSNENILSHTHRPYCNNNHLAEHQISQVINSVIKNNEYPYKPITQSSGKIKSLYLIIIISLLYLFTFFEHGKVI
jgi:hypothetical protein